MRQRLARLARDEIAERIGRLVGEMLKPIAVASEAQALVADHVAATDDRLDGTRVLVSVEIDGRPETRRTIFGARVAA